jgi:hypothetical protein
MDYDSIFQRYDKSTTSVMEIISAYFVDVYYNIIYDRATKYFKQNGTGTSLTDMYKRCVVAYVQGNKENPDYCKETINGVIEYFSIYNPNYGKSQINRTVDLVISKFVPDDYFPSLTTTQKDQFMYKITTDIIVKMARHCTQIAELSKIIDNHKSKKNVRDWQDQCNYIQIEAREAIFADFLRQMDKSDPDTINSSLLVTIAKYKEAMKKMREENIQLKRHAKYLEQMVKLMKTKMYQPPPPQPIPVRPQIQNNIKVEEEQSEEEEEESEEEGEQTEEEKEEEEEEQSEEEEEYEEVKSTLGISNLLEKEDEEVEEEEEDDEEENEDDDEEGEEEFDLGDDDLSNF